MRHRVCSAALVALLLSGCAGMNGRGPLLAGRGPDAADQLLFIDRLAVAGTGELRETGRELRRALEDGGGRAASLRYALWLATPGHPGHDAEAARRRLESLLVDTDGLPPDTRALVRMELRTVRARSELRDSNARLTRDNERLREQIEALTEQIRALTELERRMGSGEE